MTIEYHPSPIQFRGKGTVWLAFSGIPEPEWWGYWDLSPDGPTTPLEDAGKWNSVRGAVEWGLTRTNRVFVRLDETGGYYWAGEGEVPDFSGKDELEGRIELRSPSQQDGI